MNFKYVDRQSLYNLFKTEEYGSALFTTIQICKTFLADDWLINAYGKCIFRLEVELGTMFTIS